MRVFVGSVFGFIAGAVVSYFALMVGYSVWIDLFKVHDQDGGGAMAMLIVAAARLSAIPATAELDRRDRTVPAARISKQILWNR